MAVNCNNCSGTGRKSKPCTGPCRGSGVFFEGKTKRTCGTCSGTGILWESCGTCSGTGKR
jgi:DnaJ-class molecular chaperone